MSGHLFGILLYVGVLAFIAWWGYREVRNVPDYVLGGRRLNWFVAALSAVATGMSGWLMLGLPGEAYTTGGTVFWLIAGLMCGALLNWLFVAKPLRIATAANHDALTIPVFLAERASRLDPDTPGYWRTVPGLVRRFAGLGVLVFLGLYTATGMVAGGKLFANVFGLEYAYGVSLISVMVVSYSLMGGFFSISWSDVLQVLMMLLVLLLTMLLALAHTPAPGVGAGVAAASLPPDQIANYLSPFVTPEGVGVGAVVIISSLSWGLGYFGQPHVLARFKALRSPEEQRLAWPVATTLTLLCMLGAAAVGMIARTDLSLPDPETALLHFIEVLYNPWVGGLALAAVLAAVMSTADSQLLVAATALTHDLLEGERHRSLRGDRMALVLVAAAATVLALDPNNTIFGLVAYAWAGLGASFGPAILLSLYWSRLTGKGILAAVVTGMVTVFGWDFLPYAPGTGLYVLAPAFGLSLLAAVAVSLVTAQEQEGDQAEAGIEAGTAS